MINSLEKSFPSPSDDNCGKINSLDQKRELLRYNIIERKIPEEILTLKSREQRLTIANIHQVPPEWVVVHRKQKETFSIYINGSKLNYLQIEYFQKKREEKKERLRREERRYQTERERKCTNRQECQHPIEWDCKWKLQYFDRHPHKSDDHIFNKLPHLILRKEKEATLKAFFQNLPLVIKTNQKKEKANWNLAPWKVLSRTPMSLSDHQLLWKACRDKKTMMMLIDAFNEAEDLLCKSPDGQLKADALRNKKCFRTILELPNGDRLLGGILKCIDLRWIKQEPGITGRTQRYLLGDFVQYLEQLQEYWRIPNKKLERSIEEFNRNEIVWAMNKGYEYCYISGFVYAKIGNRYYNKLNMSTPKLLIKRLRAMGCLPNYGQINNDITRVDIDASLPTEMNLLAKQLKPDVIRPSTQEIKKARKVTAICNNIPEELSKQSHSASHSGSQVGILSECWNGFDEVDNDTRLEIAKCPMIRANRAIFEENFRIFDQHGCFDFIEDRAERSKASIYSMLYCKLEKQRMTPVYEYLEALGILFIPKHDGVDIFSPITESQKTTIKRLIGISCTIENGIDDVKEDHIIDVDHFEIEKLKRGEEAQYDVQHCTSFPSHFSFCDASPTESPPKILCMDQELEQSIEELHKIINHWYG